MMWTGTGVVFVADVLVQQGVERSFSALLRTIEKNTCGSELQISLHERFPLLFKELARNKTCAASLYVTGLGGKHVHA